MFRVVAWYSVTKLGRKIYEMRQRDCADPHNKLDAVLVEYDYRSFLLFGYRVWWPAAPDGKHFIQMNCMRWLYWQPAPMLTAIEVKEAFQEWTR